MRFIKKYPERERPLFAYQQEVLESMHRAADSGRDYHGIFFQMRLGKTLQAIRYCKSRGHNKVLVVCPLSIIEPTWKAELIKEQLPFFQFTQAYLTYLRSPKSAGEKYHYQTLEDIWKLPCFWAVTNYEFLMGRKPRPLPAPDAPVKYADDDNGYTQQPYTGDDIDLESDAMTFVSHVGKNGKAKGKPRLDTGTIDRPPHNLHQPPDGEPWDAVIIDESVRLANHKNKISEFCCNNFRDAKCRIILTGEATPNDLAQYFQPIKFLKGSFIGETEYQTFRYRNFTTNDRGKLLPYGRSLPKMQDELKEFCYKVRRQDVNVGSEKVYQQRIVDFKPAFRVLYNFMEENWALNETMTEFVVVAQNYLHQMCGGFPKFDYGLESHHKYEALKDLLDGELHEEKVVIWCKFRNEAKRLRERLQHDFPDTMEINGSVPVSERTHIIEQFQTTSNINKLICTYGTLEMGIDLSASDSMIYYSNTWSRNVRLQSEDRIIHPRKKYPLLYIDLVVPDSIDQDVIENHADKAARTDSFNEKIYESFINRMRKRQSGSDSPAGTTIVVPERFRNQVNEMKNEAKSLSVGLV